MRKMAKKIVRLLTDRDYRFMVLSSHGLCDTMDDEEYLKRKFRAVMGRELDLENPRTFNEKLQWLKLYNRKPEYTMMVDKVLVRDYIARTIGEEYLIPLLGVWDDPDEIDFDKLPDQFVLKCNHNSGLGMCICKDKSKLDIEKVRSELRKGLKQDYYLPHREWPYKDVPRKILCEKYMGDGSGELKDYKFMSFGGEVKCSFVCSDRFSPGGLRVTFFDRNWEVMPFERHYPKSDLPIEKPHSYDKMLSLAEKLSAGIPFVRVDLYEISGHPYFGELTFFPGSGYEEFTPESWDAKLGDWITLPEKTGSGRK